MGASNRVHPATARTMSMNARKLVGIYGNAQVSGKAPGGGWQPDRKNALGIQLAIEQ
jgi:hypothetical protein